MLLLVRVRSAFVLVAAASDGLKEYHGKNREWNNEANNTTDSNPDVSSPFCTIARRRSRLSSRGAALSSRGATLNSCGATLNSRGAGLGDGGGLPCYGDAARGDWFWQHLGIPSDGDHSVLVVCLIDCRRDVEVNPVWNGSSLCDIVRVLANINILASWCPLGP